MSSTQGIPLWQVNAFADRPFAGNPAAVCILPSYPSDKWLQQVAAEMNLSETSFIVPTDEANQFHLRWFTPTTEVDLCGHATLAAAHTLIEQNRIASGSAIRFQTRSGELPCSQSGPCITLDFPLASIHHDVDASTKTALLTALGLQDATVMRTKFDLLVVVNDARMVESLRPSFNLLESIETRGVVVTAASQTVGIDFVSRFFAPRYGIQEDPVTGSAHCCLAPFWGERLSKTSLVGYQASPRGGTVYCEVTGDRVLLSGKSVNGLGRQTACFPRMKRPCSFIDIRYSLSSHSSSGRVEPKRGEGRPCFSIKPQRVQTCELLFAGIAIGTPTRWIQCLRRREPLSADIYQIVPVDSQAAVIRKDHAIRFGQQCLCACRPICVGPGNSSELPGQLRNDSINTKSPSSSNSCFNRLVWSA